MGRLVHSSIALLLVALVAVAAAAAGTANDPRREQERLNPRDTALAKGAVLTRADVGPGWRQVALPADDGTTLTCPGFAPDFSRFTITGKGGRGFTGANGSSIVSLVEVYASRAQALGDYRLGAQPAFARCLGTLLERGVGSTGGALDFRVRSSRTQSLRGVGERGKAFRLVGTISAAGTSVELYLDVLVFQRGRSIAALMFTSAFERIPGQLRLARVVARRLR